MTRHRQVRAEVEELVKAIHRLPLPPQEMGDGPDERVGFVITLLGRAPEMYEFIKKWLVTMELAGMKNDATNEARALLREIEGERP